MHNHTKPSQILENYQEFVAEELITLCKSLPLPGDPWKKVGQDTHDALSRIPDVIALADLWTPSVFLFVFSQTITLSWHKDHGTMFSHKSSEPTMPPWEIIARYGYWQIKEHINHKEPNWTALQIVTHRCYCTQEAGKALLYASKSKLRLALTKREEQLATTVVHAYKKMGSKAGRKKAARYDEIKQYIQNLARQMAPASGRWPSRRNAVGLLLDKFKAHPDFKRLGMSDAQAHVTLDSYLKNMDDAHTLFTRKQGMPTG